MVGIVGKLSVEYSVKGKEYKEVFDIGEDERYILKGCPECNLFIEEVTYIIDTIYGVTVCINDDDDDESIYVAENREEEFSISDLSINGKMKIVMF